MKPPKAIYSYVAAAVLALITLVTFFRFQDFGPQSVIRRFHIAAASGDLPEAGTLTTEAVTSPFTREMIGIVTDLVSSNASYEVASIQRSHGEVLVAVEYRVPSPIGIRVIPIVWHVRQMQNEWRIDCPATLAQLRQQVGDRR